MVDREAPGGHLENGPDQKSLYNTTTTVMDGVSSSEKDSSESCTQRLDDEIPEKAIGKPLRRLRFIIMIVYRRLFTVMGLCNVAIALAFAFKRATKSQVQITMAANLATGVVIRQDFVINGLYTLFCSVPRTWPLCIRAQCAKIYHLGGVHSGAGVFAALWLLASNVTDEVCAVNSCRDWDRPHLPVRVLNWLIMALFLGMVLSAWPGLRKKHHNLFEAAHRFVGWTMVALFWAQVVLSINYTKSGGTSLGLGMAKSPVLWLLVVITISIAISWMFLRKIEVGAQVLSNHASRLHLDGSVLPPNGSFVRISQRPLLEWHSFATVPTLSEKPAKSGYSVLVSNAGDWTDRCIQKPPSKIWIRGIPVCGVMHVAKLFHRVVLIATGSGIGPMLGQIQRPGGCATQLIWSTPRPEETYGSELMGMIKSGIPNAVIHDTKLHGRPDLVTMGYNLATAFEAEAVLIIANERLTKKVVYGLETRGIHAYGAIWDS